MELYHCEIGMPTNFVPPTGRVALRWTKHALRARTNDRYGSIPMFRTATLDNLKVIEVGMESGKVSKILFRGRMDATRDLCMVLIPGREWTVKTVWINESKDSHSTLDKSKYVG